MRPEPLLSSRVLDLIDAYGGIERWRSVEELILTASVGGSSLYAKHQGKTIRHLQAHISPQRQRVVIIPYPKIGACGIFDEGTVRIESDGDDVLAERLDARSAFRGLRHQLWWDKLDMLYFCSYALWTYLTTPFTLVEPGFEVRELESWEEAHETWRRVSVTFPSDIHTHTLASRSSTSTRRGSYADTITRQKCLANGPKQHTIFTTTRPSMAS